MRAVILTVFLLASAAPAAASSPCGDGPSELVVRTGFDAPSYDFRTPYARLPAVAAEHDGVAGDHSGRLMGLALHRTELSSTRRLRYATDGRTGKLVCARVQRLTVDFAVRDVRVYVARELRRGSCAHHEVLAHEELHVDVARRLVRRYEPSIRRYMGRVLAALGEIRADSLEDANAIVDRYLKDSLDEIHARAVAELERRNAAIDTPEEYARITDACGGQIRKLLARAPARR